MFHQHNTQLDLLARSNYRRFVHPGDPQPEWVRRAAEQHDALRLLRADRKAERRARRLAVKTAEPRPGLIRRFLPQRSRA